LTGLGAVEVDRTQNAECTKDSRGVSFVYNLRFPGQYYQAETGLNQNVNRDYDPLTGGYIESDPLGLQGGSASPYVYVRGNPLWLTDPLGLCIDRARCARLRQRIDAKAELLHDELSKYDPIADAVGGYPQLWGSGLTVPGGHYIEIQNLQ
jgi:RHS repeat-associated protein